MDIMGKYSSFVKEQIAFQERMARRYEAQPWRRDLHLGNVNKLSDLLRDLEYASTELAKRESELNKATISHRSITLTPEDLDGLPDEVLQELNISDADKQEFAVVGIINESGGISSLDKIIVGLYRKTGEAVKRNALTSRLYRMAQKGLIYNVPMKKGFYATKLTTEQDVRRIFGLEDSEQEDEKDGRQFA